MALIKIKVIGLNKIKVQLNKAIYKHKNIKQINKAVLIQLEAWIKRNFVAEGGLHEDSSLKWKPLSPVTIMMRKKGKGQGEPKILQDTGRLKGDWRHYPGNKSSNLISGANYASTHEEGGPSEINGKTVFVPQRKIFPKEEQAEKVFKKVYEHFAQKTADELNK